MWFAESNYFDRNLFSNRAARGKSFPTEAFSEAEMRRKTRNERGERGEQRRNLKAKLAGFAIPSLSSCGFIEGK
jgi:hypothetical protein